MFSEVQSRTGHFSITPIPFSFFEIPPLSGAALLVLSKFDNNSAALRAEHAQGIAIAVGQANGSVGALEIYGITDRSGSEALNFVLSTKRAQNALTALSSALSLNQGNIVFANGLGERFAAEFRGLKDNTRDSSMRGVACYLWESFSTARDPFLRISVAFAGPPTGGIGLTRQTLPALHMGRLRAQPPSPFA